MTQTAGARPTDLSRNVYEKMRLLAVYRHGCVRPTCESWAQSFTPAPDGGQGVWLWYNGPDNSTHVVRSSEVGE